MRPRLGIMMLALAALAVACGDPASFTDDDPASLEGRTFLSSSVSEGGEPRALEEGTRIRLSFADGNIGASAGCNSFGATYELRHDVLDVGSGAVTEIGCSPALHDQDEWLFGFLGRQPRAELLGERLTLTAGETVITLVDREVADPDRPLTATTWLLDGIIEGEAVSSIPAGVEAWIELSEVEASIHTGCNGGSSTVTFTSDRITFGPIAMTRKACTGPLGDVERAMLAVLSGEVAYTIEAATLTVDAGARGLIFTANER